MEHKQFLGMDLSSVSFGPKGEPQSMEAERYIVMDTKPPPPPTSYREDLKTGFSGNDAEPDAVVMNPKVAAPRKPVKYRECMRNHAASVGGHVSDGCGEFMLAAGVEETKERSLSCAACGCHRNFHRREVPGGDGKTVLQHRHHQRRRTHHSSPPRLLLPSFAIATPLQARACGGSTPHHHRNSLSGMISAIDLRDRRSETPEREEAGPRFGSAKRFRTKFTAEQKERMLEYAERIGWRIQRQDEAALAAFCAEVGVKRNVLKVWMHNNKSALRRREAASSPAPAAAPPQPAGV